MKILFVCCHFKPYVGGLENYVLELGKELVRNGEEVSVLTLNTEGVDDFECYGGVNIFRVPCRVLIKDVYAVPKKNWKLAKMIGSINIGSYDFVVTNTRFFYTSFWGMRLAKLFKVKFVHIEHGSSYVKHNNKVIQFVAWCYDQLLGRAVMRNAKLVIGISKGCEKFAKKLGAKRTKVIPNSVDVEWWK